jgi:hypothetical protein
MGLHKFETLQLALFMRARRNDTLPITMVEVLFRLDAIIMPSLGGELQTFAVTLIDLKLHWLGLSSIPDANGSFRPGIH